MSFCSEHPAKMRQHEVRGMVFTKDHVLEIQPLNDRLKQVLIASNKSTHTFHSKASLGLVTRRGLHTFADR